MDRSAIEKISKALADQTRLKIFEAISASGHMNCGQIVSMRGVTPATVSHHLKILRQCGLVQTKRQGRFIVYSLHPDVFAAAEQPSEHLDLGCCRLELPKDR